ncbi:hypothetical protein AB1N83_011332 [Pleurotus pulmonarius]|nr:hypothetical protein EYR38_008494 [Pleurotus pulmonarius]
MLLNTLAALVALCASYAKADAIPVKCSMASFPNVPVPVALPAALPCVPTILPAIPSLGIVNIQPTACPVTQLDCELECAGPKPITLHACMNPTGLPGLPTV